MKRVNLELSDELYAQVRAAAGDVPVNRWLRRAVERELNGPSDESLRRADRMIRDGVRSSSQAKRNVKPIPKGNR